MVLMHAEEMVLVQLLTLALVQAAAVWGGLEVTQLMAAAAVVVSHMEAVMVL